MLVAGSAKLYGIDQLGNLGIATPDYEDNFLKQYLFTSEGGSNNKLRDDVHFLGAVPHSSLGELIATCRVALVNPSWESSETCCNSALEAQASGTPVVGINIGSLPEVISDRSTGIIVYRPDDNLYAQSVASVLNDPTLSKKLGNSAREFVLTNFNYENQAKKWITLFEFLLVNDSIPYELTHNWYKDSFHLSVIKWIARKTKLGLIAREVIDNYRSIKKRDAK